MLHAPVSERKNETAQGKPVSAATAVTRSPGLQGHQVFGNAQATYGNQAVLRMLRGLSNTGRVLQRKCACGSAAGMAGGCEECGKEKPLDLIQRFSGRSTEQMDVAPASVDQALASAGRPLEPALRGDMEQRFGHDFSRVRIHSGVVDEQSAREVNAHAYTVGHDIVFARGQYAPSTIAGRQLLAHELAHVVQQSNSSHAAGASLSVSHLDSAEAEADSAARDVAAGLHSVALGYAPRTVARQPAAAAKKCPATHTIPDDIYKAIVDAWALSGQGQAAVTEHGGRIVTDSSGKQVIRTGGGGGGSISLPAEQAGDVTQGTFHTHPYSKAEGSKLGVSFSGGDIENFIAGGQGSFKYVGAGTCIYALDTLDSTVRDGCKTEDIPKRWNDSFAKASGNFQMKVDTAVRTAIVGCGLCYYGTCSKDLKTPVPKTANLS